MPSYQYAETLRWLQMFYNFGGIAFTAVPGIIADHTGEYKSSYVLFAAIYWPLNKELKRRNEAACTKYSHAENLPVK